MNTLPIAVIGAGPIGLAAAAHLLARGLTPIVFEAGPTAGSSIQKWAHVRMFSPWNYNIDQKARALLEQEAWLEPDLVAYPTGSDLIEFYLKPLAANSALSPHIHYQHRVLAVTRQGKDLMKHADRSKSPFLIRVENSAGEERDYLVQAVIDASGTYDKPNPLGSHGLPVVGEKAASAHIFYGIPDVLGRDEQRYAKKRVLVVGSGHSAFQALQDLAKLRETEPGTQIYWAIRRPSLERVLGGGEKDKLQERGRLGGRIGKLLAEEVIQLFYEVSIDRLNQTEAGLVVASGSAALPAVDEIIVTTGFRPDLSLLSEIRLDLDPATQSPKALAPLIDPNLHSCGTVRPHGAEELRHPEENFFIVGMKSYGRAPTFLLLTGYEQVRSVVSAIAGDWRAARKVELKLPETGVCNRSPQTEVPVAKSKSQAVCCG